MSEEEDLEYVSQLRSVFDSCDTTATGTLNRKELLQLCEKLEFESQAPALIDMLIGDDPDARVDFENFKDAFITLLTEGVVSSEDEENKDHIPPDAPPSRQELLLRLEDIDEDQESSSGCISRNRSERSESKLSHGTSSRVSPRMTPRTTPTMTPRTTPTMTPRTSPAMTPDVSRTSSPCTSQGQQHRKHSETFEAEGQMEPPKADGDLAVEEHRRHIHLVWQELGVGRNGFLTMEELASVCQKIGMEQMNDEELHHLFEKLDVDCDGRVSFDEFLHGLFQYGGTSTAHSPSRQLSSTPRQKLRKALSSHFQEHQQTPSLITSGSGLFSTLDIDNTGFAKPDDIIALWESFGIPQGAEILEYLQFSLTSKINLLDLSYALEHEMRTVEEDNATYQAAIASYENELRFLKNQAEHLIAERNKLKADLAEVNNRVIILVKEGDERYSLLEKSKEKELDELEKKYQEQIQALQSELERERETFYNQSSTEKQQLESTVNILKEEESKLKSRVSSVQKEYERLEKENRDMADRYAELEAKKERLQKDLEGTAELQQKLEEMESSRDVFLDEHQKFSEQKLRQLELENKELKDKDDELTVQIEELRQQLLAYKRRFGYTTDQPNSNSPLLDYDKLFRADNYSPQGTGDEASEDDVSVTRTRRRLPRRPSDVQSDDVKGVTIVSLLTEKLQDEVNQLKLEKESLLNQHQEELKSLEKQYEERINSLLESNEALLKAQERQLEEKLGALRNEHDSIVQSIRKDHQEIIKSLESHYQHKLTEQEQQLQSENNDRLKALQHEHEVELTLLQSKHEEMLDKLQEEYENRIKEIESKEASQLEGIDEYQEKIKAMEKKHAEELERLKEEYESKIKETEAVFAEQLKHLQQEHEEQIRELERKHEAVLDSLQTEHDEEVKGLQQKLDGLFSESSIKTEEVVALQRGFSIERKDIEDAYKMEIAEMEDRHMQEMNELIKKTKAEKESLQKEFDVKLKEKVQEVEERIKQEVEEEKQEVMIKSESQKNLLHVEFEKEKERIIAEHELELAKKDVEVEKLHEKINSQSDELQKQKAAYELQMKLQKEELELEFKKEKMNMLEKFEQEKSKLLEKHRNDIYDYENIFIKGTEGLRGQLQRDFFKLLEEHKQQEKEKLQAELNNKLQKEKEHIIEELKKEPIMQLEELRREKEQLEKEHEALLQNKDVEKKCLEEEAERERKRIIDELTSEKERLEREWKADKDRLSKLGVLGVSGGLKDVGEGQVISETREVRREVSHLVYDRNRVLERIQRSGTNDDVLGQEIILNEKETIVKQFNSTVETELTKTVGENTVQDSEKQNTVNNTRIETSKLETADGKCVLAEHIDKSDSTTVELDKTVRQNDKTVKSEHVRKDRNNNRTASDNDYVNKDAVLVALTPIDPILLENANFTDKQKEFIRRWRSKSNVRDKIKMFSAGKEDNGNCAAKLLMTDNTINKDDDKELLLNNVQCQNIYPEVIIRESPKLCKNRKLGEDGKNYLKSGSCVCDEDLTSLVDSFNVNIHGSNGDKMDLEKQSNGGLKTADNGDDTDGDITSLKHSQHMGDKKNPPKPTNKVDTKRTADTPNTADVNGSANTQNATEIISSEEDRVKIIKEVHKEKEIVATTKFVGNHRSKQDACKPETVKEQNPLVPRVLHSQQPLTTPKNTPPRKKPRLDKPINLPPETDWVYIRERKRNSSFLVSVFSIFLRVHMAKNGW